MTQVIALEQNNIEKAFKVVEKLIKLEDPEKIVNALLEPFACVATEIIASVLIALGKKGYFKFIIDNQNLKTIKSIMVKLATLISRLAK